MMDNITPDVEGYFREQCEEHGFKVVPGHCWKSEMNTKEQIDKWVSIISESFKAYWCEGSNKLSECPREFDCDSCILRNTPECPFEN